MWFPWDSNLYRGYGYLVYQIYISQLPEQDSWDGCDWGFHSTRIIFFNYLILENFKNVEKNNG